MKSAQPAENFIIAKHDKKKKKKINTTLAIW